MDDELYLDISEQEASSEGQKPVPAGRYHVAVTDVELKESKSEANPGKPMYGIELTIQSGQYEGRKIFDNACLWAGASYTIVQITKAMGLDVPANGQGFRVPKIGELQGQEFEVRVIVEPAKGQYDEKNAVKGYFPYGQGTRKTPLSGEASLLP
jgi:hypothetical protein